jgi:hypothetical protein
MKVIHLNTLKPVKPFPTRTERENALMKIEIQILLVFISGQGLTKKLHDTYGPFQMSLTSNLKRGDVV